MCVFPYQYYILCQYFIFQQCFDEKKKLKKNVQALSIVCKHTDNQLILIQSKTKFYRFFIQLKLGASVAEYFEEEQIQLNSTLQCLVPVNWARKATVPFGATFQLYFPFYPQEKIINNLISYWVLCHLNLEFLDCNIIFFLHSLWCTATVLGSEGGLIYKLSVTTK